MTHPPRADAAASIDSANGADGADRAGGPGKVDEVERPGGPAEAVPPRARVERALAEEIEALSDVSAHLGRAFARGHELHDTDFRALSLIHVAQTRGRAVTPAVLGAELGLTSGAVTYLVDRLERGGHVVRDRDPRDGRRVVLRYADHGRRVASAFFGPLVRHQHDALTAFSDAELEVARRVLAAATGALRDYDAELSTGSAESGEAGRSSQ